MKTVIDSLRKFKYILVLVCCFCCSINDAKAYVFILQGNVFSEDNLHVIPNKQLVFVNAEHGIFENTTTTSGGFYQHEFNIQDSASLKIYIYAIKGCTDSSMTIVDSVQSHEGWLDVNLYLCYKEPSSCEAGFVYEHTDRATIQFYDTTIQDAVSWMWDFGDGKSSNKQNPIHEYSSAGNFRVELTIQTSDYCQSSYIDYVLVEEAEYVRGYVYAGVNKLPAGRIVAYLLDSVNEEPPHDNNTYSLDTGYFSIPYELVSNHILYFIPELDLPQFHSPVYFPTYLGNQKYWGDALSVSSEMVNSSILVNLIKEDEFYYGHGSISGWLDYESSPVAKNNEISILLLDNQKNPIRYLFFDSDYKFNFENIPWGDYFLVVNYVGISSEPIPVSISNDNSEVEVVLKEDMKNIVMPIDEDSYVLYYPSPNPFDDGLYLPFLENVEKTEKKIEIFNIRGVLVYSILCGELSDRYIDLGFLTSGFYILKTGAHNYKIRKK